LTKVEASETLHDALVGVLFIELRVVVGQNWHAATNPTQVASVSITHPRYAARTGVERDDSVVNVVVAKIGIGHDDGVVDGAEGFY
jgi:hypothetical protein